MFNAPIADRLTTLAAILLSLSLAACGPDASQSEAVPFASGMAQTPSRVVADLVALYEFSEGSGPTVLDTSGVAPLLDLTIEDPTAVTWTSGGLSLDSPTAVSSVGAATKLIDAVQTAEEVTVEAWVSSSNLGQNGPARIVSVSSTSSSRNMTLGQGVYNQGGDRFEVRLRSTATSNNGTPATQTPQGSLTAGLHHVVYTRDAAGQATAYIDGVVEGQASVGGSLSNWDATMPLLLGNEANGSRPWLGEYKLVAVYARALSAAEVAQNLSAGSEGDGSTVNIPPVAVVAATPQSGAAPLTVTLDGTSSTDIDGTIVDYAWDLGDGTMLSGQSVQHTYNDPGVYTATLTVTDDGGESANESASISAFDPSGGSRVVTDLVALYEFSEGSGATVLDTSSVAPLLDLTIEDPTAVTWTSGGLSLDSPTVVSSVGAATKLIDAAQTAEEVTVEAWVSSSDLGQNGPARIVSVSSTSSSRNMTLGQGVYNQGGDRFEVRFRSTATSNNGSPATQTPQGSLTAGLHHVVYTRDAGGQATVYIDGVVEGQASVGGSLSNWDATMPLLLGNEANGSRPWLGEYKLVAVYARALSAAEVAQNLSAGSEGDGSTVNIPPVAVVAATPQSGAAPLTVTLDGTSSTDIDGTIVDYAWDLGDGTMVSGQSVQHTYTDPGVYTATLTVTDDGGLSAAASTSLQVDTGPSEANWWTSSLSKRLPIAVSSQSVPLQDGIASMEVDLLSALGGAALDPDQFRLVEYDASGEVIDPAVPFQFDPAQGFDPVTDPRGALSILLTGNTPASTERTYHLYFAASSGATFYPPPVLPLVAPVELVSDEGQQSYKITTPSGTWFYQLEGGGFSSLEDANGNDWISYQPGGGSAGEFRGIPNLVYPEGHFHPGATSSQTTLLSQGPLKMSFASETTDGWRMIWDVYPAWATATVLDAPKNYWFLYEGTPGGAVEPNSDTVTRSGGVTTLLSQSWTQDLPGPEWVYFTDPAQGRALFVAPHEDDAATDSYRTMNGEMTVFGFGRDGLGRELSGTPKTFSVGLSESASVEVAIASAAAPIVVQSSAAESRPNDPTATTAAIAPNITLGGVPLTLSFDGLGSNDPGGSIVSYAWDFGDGATGSGPNPSHEYAAPGVYEITLTVTDAEGATVEDHTSLVVAPNAPPPNAAPTAQGTATPLTGTAPLTVSFDASASSDDGTIVSYAWDFGDGATGSGALTSHVYTTPGTYTATVTVTDDGGLTDSAGFTITALSGGGTGGTGGSGTGGTGGSGTGGTGGTAGTGGTTPPGAIVSDDFYTGVLDTQLWEVVDPQGDGTVEMVGAGTSDAHLRLSVPAGTVHDPWRSNNTALRVMQPAADEDFAIEAKFESEPTQKYQIQGLLVEEDSDDYLRFDVYHDGSSLKVFSATFTNGSPSVRVNSTIASGPTTYLRLTRNSNQWTAEYSYDGSSWTTAASFSHTMTVWSVGPFAGNAGPNPAYTAVVDYFFDVASPIVPEDAPLCDPGDEFVVTVASNGNGTVNRDPDQSTYACGELVTLTAQPDPGAQFLSWTGSVSSTANPLVLAVSGDTNATANFELDETAPVVSNVDVVLSGSSATISWETDEPTLGSVDFGETTSYELGSVDSTMVWSTTHSATIQGLTEGTLYHYRINAEDAAGNMASEPDRTFAATVGDGPFVDVWYGDYQTFGDLGNPQRWINVLGQVIDPDGISGLSFSLNGGASRSLSVGPFRRLADPGDFNVEIDYAEMLPGTNTIEIQAVDGLGFETTKMVTVDYSAGSVWPLSYSVDWASAVEISDVAQVVDGRWSIVGGALRNDRQRYDRTVAIGDITWTDYEVTVPVTIHGFSAAASGGVNGYPAVGVMLRWPGHSDWTGDQPTWGYYPLGGGGWYEFTNLGPGRLKLTDFEGTVNDGDPFDRVLALGATYIWKVRVEAQADGSSLYRMKVWAEGSAEPSGWELVDTDPTDVPGGSLLLVAHFTDVSFGDISIDPL